MWVWNYNGSSELDMGAGAKSTTIEYLVGRRPVDDAR